MGPSRHFAAKRRFDSCRSEHLWAGKAGATSDATRKNGDSKLAKNFRDAAIGSVSGVTRQVGHDFPPVQVVLNCNSDL
jgi:hypothetical protein